MIQSFKNYNTRNKENEKDILVESEKQRQEINDEACVIYQYVCE